MITVHGKTFVLSTKETTLLLRVNEVGKLVCDHYGRRIGGNEDDLAAAAVPTGMPTGRSVTYDEEAAPKVCLSSIAAEYSAPHKGDFHSPMVEIVSEKGRVYDFTYVSHEQRPYAEMEGYPNPHGADEEFVVLCRDEAMGAELELHYVLFVASDVIGRYCVVRNVGEGDFSLRRIMSYQFTFQDQGYVLKGSYSSWAGEFQNSETPIGNFRYEFGSDSGSSGDQHNPFFMVKSAQATLRHGNCYGFNLIYSGSHRTTVEKDAFGLIRVIAGISPQGFEKVLAKGESFMTPMAVLTFSHLGLNGISRHMHHFVNHCVIPENFAFKPRPIAFNNWEGTYMKFTEAKLKALAKTAADLGCELFVLDDGWFGHRDTDSTSLGDWNVYKKKLPHGIEGIANYVHDLNMKFGLWFEPEAISPDSDLFAAHPDWAIQDGIHKPSLGRHQLVLDLTKPEVRDFLFEALSNHLSTGLIDFVKWDYNRPFSDLPASGSFCHDYILGLYDLLERLVSAFPNILFENCASGGGRNDLGMFCYFPQGWVSDDTDSFERAKMQAEMAYGYPPSVMSNHVSAKTSHQMLRRTGYGTKFDVACIGILGYEMDISDLDSIDVKAIKDQIKFYKKYRETLQYGIYFLHDTLENGRLIVQMGGARESLVTYVNAAQTPHPGNETLPLTGLKPEATYHYFVRHEMHNLKTFGSLINMVTPIHIKEEGVLVNTLSRYRGLDAEGLEGKASGATLNAGALQIGRQWAGTGYDESTRILLDFGARVYVFEQV